MVAEKKISLYKKVTGWVMGDTITKDKGSNRQIAKLVLGEITVKGRIEQYITEDIYYDVLENVCTNAQDYDIAVKINMVPQVTILLDGQLIPHNPDISMYVEKIISTIEEIPKDTLIDGYNEMRLNMNSKSKLGDATELLCALIRKKTGIHFSVPFIRAIIAQWIEDTYYPTDNNEWKEELRNYDYAELVTLCNEIIKMKCEISSSNELLTNYLKSTRKEKTKALNEFEIMVGTELTLRMVKGTIKQR